MRFEAHQFSMANHAGEEQATKVEHQLDGQRSLNLKQLEQKQDEE